MSYPTYSCKELKESSLGSLYNTLRGCKIPEDQLGEYQNSLKRAKEMAESGEITSSVDIRRLQIILIAGKRGSKKGGSGGGIIIA